SGRTPSPIPTWTAIGRNRSPSRMPILSAPRALWWRCITSRSKRRSPPSMTSACARRSAKRSSVTPSASWGPNPEAVGTGNYPFGPWGMPKERRNQLIGYGPDMAKRLAHAKALLAAYEQEKGKIDWKKLKAQCATNVKFTCENGQIMQQLLKKINVNVDLEPMLVSQLRGNEVSGNYLMSQIGAALNFADPIDVFGHFFVTVWK